MRCAKVEIIVEMFRANLLSHVGDPLWYNNMVACELAPGRDEKKFGERETEQ